MDKLKMAGVFLLLIALFGCSKKDESDKYSDVLAVVGNDTIRTAELIKLLDKQNRNKVDVQDDKARQDLLNSLVQTKLIYFYGREKKLNELKEIKLDVSTKSDEMYYTRILREYVYYPMITEDTIKSFFEKLKTEVRVQQILIGYRDPSKVFVLNKTEVKRSKVEAKKLADSLYWVLTKTPVLFESIVERFSDDDKTKYLKGDAGFVRWGMRPGVEESIFSIKQGAISNPVAASNGYYIFRVSEKRNVSNLKPLEEAKAGIRDMLLSYLFRDQKHEVEARKKHFSDSLLRQYRFSLDPQHCGIFLRGYEKIQNPSDIESHFSDAETDMKVASYDGGEITIAELVHVMSDNTKMVKMDQKILSDGLKNVALRRICSNIAHNQNYELGQNEKETLKQYEANLMVNIAVQRMYSALDIKEEDIVAYYEANKEEYRQAGMVNIAEIASKDLQSITKIHEETKAKKNFDAVYERALKTQGFTCTITGLIPDDNSDDLRQQSRKVETGSSSEPFIKANREYALIKVIDRKHGAIKHYAEVKEHVRQDYTNFKKQIMYNEWIANLSTQYKVQIFPDRLKNVFDIKLK